MLLILQRVARGIPPGRVWPGHLWPCHAGLSTAHFTLTPLRTAAHNGTESSLRVHLEVEPERLHELVRIFSRDVVMTHRAGDASTRLRTNQPIDLTVVTVDALKRLL